ncbi:class 1 fructose-bisphosphatase [Helicobacter magdeburgensis]|uniref:Fructose-1,6-bisphosphatase class 1 n=1 Tax=Helicobacter magdeburgensis TaxID=471858 RepID=A0A4U8SYM4_9HELI|nr:MULTISPECIES: class 1 fructose-bisphosphatase [Helicobacter]TLD92140.1 class 1 fructose-bisphosphatase [Helicobacter magdeburgensis]BDB66271.1 fructose-1,6-bisphosphatase class 1 [Helicobacter cinaedi]
MISVIIETLREAALRIDTLLKDTSTSYLQSTNASGDSQLEVDVEADKLLQEMLLELPCVKGICSEEQESIVYSKNTQAPYLIAYDPLDGSSLFDSNLSIGTIFGIYNEELKADSLIASGYIIYGVRLEMVIAQEQVLHSRYNGKVWKNLGALQLQSKGKLNAPGGTQKNWESKHKAMVESLFAQGYRLRYSGGMVPDLHQILIKGGGLFSYPATSDAPQGKLRKLFEVFPFAFIYEKAGGVATNGKKRLLELGTENLHDTTPCFFGSTYEMNLVKEVYE